MLVLDHIAVVGMTRQLATGFAEKSLGIAPVAQGRIHILAPIIIFGAWGRIVIWNLLLLIPMRLNQLTRGGLGWINFPARRVSAVGFWQPQI